MRGKTVSLSFPRWLAGAIVLFQLSCSGSATSNAPSAKASGGETGTGGTGPGTGGTELGTGGNAPEGSGGLPAGEMSGGNTSTGGVLTLAPDGFPEECAEERAVPAEAIQATRVELDLRNNAEPFVFGEPNPLQQGGTFLPTNFRFYLSQFALYQGETRHPATLVNAEGAALPYGVKLVNAEDPASLIFHLASEPGDYDGISFLLGLSQGCNNSFYPLAAPLHEASQLKWPHTLGFLFLRLEGNLDQLADPETPTQIHMGSAAGDSGFAPEFFLSFPEGTDPLNLSLTVAFEAVLAGAATETDLSDFELLPPAPPTIEEEVLAGERLRRAALDVGIFSFNLEQ